MRKLVVGLVAALMILGLVNINAFAQGTLREYTGYQVMNLATCAGCVAHVRVDYYGPSGGNPAFSRNLDDIPPGGSTNVQQKTESGLADGVYSAVLSSDQPIAAIVGQIEADPATSGLTYFAPFSNYTGASAGSRTVTLPELHHNWYGSDSLIRVQNAGDGPANITIQYVAATLGGVVAGQTGIPAETHTVARYAAKTLDQSTMAATLAATTGTYQGKFLGSAVITSDQPLVTVVNLTLVQQRLKFTYNGFGTEDAGTELLAPAIFSKWFNTLTSLSIANAGTTPVTVNIVYTAGPGSLLANGSNGEGTTKSVTVNLAPGESSTRYEGNGTLGDVYNEYQRFSGSARVSANGNIVAKVNQTSYTPVNNRNPSGAYNALPTSRLTTRIAAPLIQADFYSYFTSLTCANASTTQAASITVSYTSDTLSVRPNVNGTATHNIPAGGSIIRYEATRGGPLADINKAGSPWDNGTTVRFNGSAFVTSNGPAIACVVNEVGASVTNDNMNTYNSVSLQP